MKAFQAQSTGSTSFCTLDYKPLASLLCLLALGHPEPPLCPGHMSFHLDPS